jgi:hypothetical protein
MRDNDLLQSSALYRARTRSADYRKRLPPLRTKPVIFQIAFSFRSMPFKPHLTRCSLFAVNLFDLNIALKSFIASYLSGVRNPKVDAPCRAHKTKAHCLFKQWAFSDFYLFHLFRLSIDRNDRTDPNNRSDGNDPNGHDIPRYDSHRNTGIAVFADDPGAGVSATSPVRVSSLSDHACSSSATPALARSPQAPTRP